jgi:hypothetical protein
MLSRDLLSQPEEVAQEEAIQAWENPDLDGYQGLLAYNELLYNKYKEYKRTNGSKNISLKKNIPAKAGISISYETIMEYVDSFDKKNRGQICLILQPFLKHLYLGKDYGSFEELAQELGISKSNLYRILEKIRRNVSQLSLDLR